MMTGIILAGGKGSRLKQNKALLEIGRTKIIEKILATFDSVFAEKIIVIDKPSDLYQGLGCRVVTDLIPGKDSLGGIYTGIHSSSFLHSFVVACDMPFLKKGLIEYFKTVADDYDVVVPKISARFEPLHAIYSKRCLAYMEDLIREDNLRILDFYPRVRVRTVSHREIKRFDPQMRSFFNINTQDELEEALRISQEPGEVVK
jgi:molybdopterin-guanine dinucleotide biosynthesis protein A